ncbi:MAG: biotin--[acetyl-CoA-carboxylase] ligase [Tatlockia sp.]|nr:biotin--[acetyl-CoA-carboxylase] ligase [Tatlockia sp.]
MKQFTSLQLKLLHFLSDGQCHQKTQLARQFGISHTAVAENIRQLLELGLSIKNLPQQGYQLFQPFKPLDEQLIRQHLVGQPSKLINFHLFAELGSTNQYLKELTPNSAVDICCAEKQTQGRGRFGRRWISPFGENIYFSYRWGLGSSLSSLSGLSLIVSLAIMACLKKSNIYQDLRIKWPNDILWKNKKLCGILIELSTESRDSAQVIIGIGLNVNTATHEQPITDVPWCSLFEISGQQMDRNKIIANLINKLDLYLEKFLHGNFASFREEWRRFDYLEGQFIKIVQANNYLSGQACGVDEQGRLCLQDKEGKIHYLSSGETSLSLKN